MACPVLIADVRVLAGEGPPVLTSPTVQLGMWTAAFSAMASFLSALGLGEIEASSLAAWLHEAVGMGTILLGGHRNGDHLRVPSGLGLCGSYRQAPGTSTSFGILESADCVCDCAISWGQRAPPPVAAIGSNEPFRAYQHYGFLLCGPTFYCLPGIRWAGYQWHPNAECHASWVCGVRFRFSGFREFQWGPPLGLSKEYLPILRVKDGVPLRSPLVIVVEVL